MATLLVRLADNAYVKWSDTTDAPVGHVMTRAEASNALRNADGLATDEVERLVGQTDTTGTSDPTVSLEALLAANRAGTHEESLSLDEILAEYREA